ncbi:MAG: APC family permease, partial [candidate division Zixibacteria bacterium]|nr:APC family permease [candidate division Zixibacteria bacterium]
FAANIDNPIAILAQAIPSIGLIAGPFAAALGALILFISANTGIVGSSRLTYYLSKFGIISPWFDAVHPKYKTPIRTILVFAGIGAFETVLSFLTPSAMDTLANMYAFGATLGYTMVFIALIKLRFSEPWTPRPYKMPLNIKLKYKGRKVLFPILGVIGALGVATILFMVVLTHTIGRIAGPVWILLCFCYYAWYRRSKGLPIFKSIEHNWEKQQMEVLTSAEEFDLLEQYKIALAERDKKRTELK